ncbi:MAG TPA: transglycosylase SLT domain-containing protein [Vicinamibacterales bacterium]|nr:transglycosylase SLT domain-containing protein [Vicinamibacterales bacterium]
MRRALAVLALAALYATAMPAQDRASSRDAAGAAADRLAATSHPPLPAQRSHYWFVPETAFSAATARRDARDAAREGAMVRLARGVELIGSADFAAALPLVNSRDLDGSVLGPYARYYTAVALVGLARVDEADAILKALAPAKLDGALKETASVLQASVAVKRGEPAEAEDLLEDLSDDKLAWPEDLLVALGRAEETLGHADHALEAYRRVYYDYPLSAQAADAADGIARVETAPLIAPDRFRRELARAQQLFDARRWAQARAAFEPLLKAAAGDDRELISLRIAECAYYLDRFSEARKLLQPYLNGSRREAEARFFHLTALRGAGDSETFVSLSRGLVADYPDSEWAAETLNNLASYFIVVDRDAEADAVFRELLRRFPRHRLSERAAWKSGWSAYRLDDFRDAAEIFDSAAATFARSDYRPSWLYWSARAYDQIGNTDTANARYRLTVTDYQNSYYGRLATRVLQRRKQPPVAASTTVAAAPPSAVRTDDLIRALTAAGLYEDALKEVQYAQRVWGDAPQLQATFAWIRHRQGLTLKATERFNAIRGAITTMRRAYPQFLAAGGEHLPPEVLRIIFPLDYWPLITKYSKAHDLDPYLIAALMVQESTFTPEIRSAANAIGLLQITPPTGRTLARQLGIRRFTTSMLTQAETNVRMGTKYLKDMVDKFGGVHYALAGYNAGPHRVTAWLKESPGLEQDEFIDNIPFTETQAYVKRILGTAEDYRRLYGSGILDASAGLTAEAATIPRATAKPPAPGTQPSRSTRSRR